MNSLQNFILVYKKPILKILIFTILSDDLPNWLYNLNCDFLKTIFLSQPHLLLKVRPYVNYA
jgi:hypothetical protein